MGRNAYTKIIGLSGKPTITRIIPTWSQAGYSASVTVQGYNFNRTKHLFLSAESGVYTNKLSAVTGFSPFNLNFYPYLFGQDKVAPGSSLSALYPAFSGFEVKVEDYSIASDNTLTFTLCATQGEGLVNIIIVNDAGYSDVNPFMDMGPVSGITRTISISA